MPITVQHSPDFNLLGGLSYAAGLGAYRDKRMDVEDQRIQRQQQIALEAEALRTRAAQTNRAQQLQVMDMQRQAQDAQARQALVDQQQQFNRQLQVKEFEGLQNWRQNQLDDNVAQREAASGLVQSKQRGDWMQGGVANLEDEVGYRVKELSKLDLTPAGEAARSKLLGELRAIQKSRAMFANKPEAYQDLTAQWLRKHDEINLPAYSKPKKTPKEQVAESTAPAFGADGRPIDAVWVMGASGPKLQPLSVNQGQGAKASQKEKSVAGVPFEAWISDSANERAWRDDAIKALSPAVKLPNAKPISEEQIQKYMRNRYAAWQRMVTGPDAPETPAALPAGTSYPALDPNVTREQQEALDAARYAPPPGSPAAKLGATVEATPEGKIVPREQYRPLYNEIVAAAGSEEKVNVARLMEDANEQEYRWGASGQPDGAKAHYTKVRNSLTEYKAIRAKYKDAKDFAARGTKAEKEKVAGLVRTFGKYMN